MRSPCLRRTRFALVGALVGLSLGVGATAWACVPIPQKLTTVDPRASGPAGANVTLHALGHEKGPVEIRWNAVNGPELARATGPDFTVPLTIPAADAGLYTIVVLSRSPDGGVATVGSTPFEVESPQDAESRSGTDVAWLAVLAGGVVLLGLGGAAGYAISRRRSPRPS